MTTSDNGNWYVNTSTGEVSQGKHPEWSHRLGPYPTAEAAAEWRSQAAARNAEADAADLDWENSIGTSEEDKPAT